MTVNVSGSSNSANPPPSLSTIPPLYVLNADFQALPSSTQDLLISSESTVELNAQYPPNMPILSLPGRLYSNSAQAFALISGATLQFSQSLNAMSEADQKMRNNTLAVLEQEIALAKQIANLAHIITTQQNNGNTAAASLSKDVANAATQASEQQSLVNSLNSQTSAYASAYSQLQAANAIFQAHLNSLGATVQHDGTYTIPSNGSAAYQAAATAYQSAVETFNSFIAQQQSMAQSYNNEVATYNTLVNTSIANFQNDLQNTGYTFSNLPPLATPIDTSTLIPLNPPPTSASDGDVVNVTIPNDVASLIANPPQAQSVAYANPLPSTQNVLARDIFKATVSSGFITRIEHQIQDTASQLSFIRGQAFRLSLTNTIPDPLLNLKNLAKKILPEAVITSTTPLKKSAGGANALASAAIGIANPHLEQILALQNFTQSLQNFQLEGTSPQQLHSITFQAQALVVGQISNSAQNALLSAVQALGPNANNINTTSSSFAIIFATSFVNRIIEATAPDGATSDIISALTAANPVLQHLTPQQADQLTASLNLGLALFAIKLLENNLGIQGLSAQLLLPLAPPELSQAIVNQANTQNQLDETQLLAGLSQNFLSQGYNQDQAEFLAQTGVELAPDLLTPIPINLPSRIELNQTLLQDSVAASLLLSDSDLSVAQARAIASTSIAQAQDQEPGQPSIVTTNSFRNALLESLQQQGISNSIAAEAAQDAVIVQNPFQPGSKTTQSLGNLSQTPSIPTALSTSKPPSSASSSPSTPPTNLTSSPTSTTPSTTPSLNTSQSTPLSPSLPPQLSQSELQTLIQNQILPLLTPQLGANLANQVSQTVATSLFGTPNPSSSEIEGVSSPHSIVNVVRHQINTLIQQQTNNFNQTLADNFSNTIQNSTDLYTFLVRAMDPAFSYIYSANAGIMYSRPTSQQGVNPSWRNTIDINV